MGRAMDSPRTQVPRGRCRRRRRPDGPPRLDLVPDRTERQILALLSSQVPITYREIQQAIKRHSATTFYRAMWRLIHEFHLPIISGFCLDSSPHTPEGRELRAWIQRHAKG